MKINHLIILIIVFILLIGCRKESDKKDINKQEILYFPQNNSIGIKYFTDKDKFSDSLLNLRVNSLAIYCPGLRNYQLLFDMINPDSLKHLRIDGYNRFKDFSQDLKKFNKLQSLFITGDQLEEINLEGRLFCKLKTLGFSSTNLKFPKFDSSFLYLENFFYSGKSDVIPTWIERLDNLKLFYLNSKLLKRIDCNICLMDSIKFFDISSSYFYEKELLYLKRKRKYNKLQKFLKCNPELRFKYKLPPR